MSQTCGELLVALLEAYGVDTVFGIPGVHTVELYRGLPNTRIQHITPRHEQGAGFMADGYARVSGKPGVCFIITGPGMTNIMTAMAQAAADAIPMLVISSVNPIAVTGSQEGHLHELPNQQALIAQVAAYSQTIWSPEQLPKALAEAFTFFKSAKPGPVHLQLPLDVITAKADHVSWHVGATAAPPEPAAQLLDAAAAQLQAAQRPMILLGGGCVQADPAMVLRLVEALQAPATTTINAKGLLPADHPLHLGSNATFAPVRQLIQEADVVLAIGTELGQTDYDLYVDHGMHIQGKLIRIDIDARQAHRSFIADLAIVGHAATAINGLCQRLAPRPINPAQHQRVATAKQALIQGYPANWAGQNALLKSIQTTLPEAIIVGDSTQPVYSGNHGYMAPAPRRWFNSATGYGTLGYALPAAIGAQLATDQPIVCLVGDGGIQFSLPELMCATECRLPIIIVLWHNQGYGEIRSYMKEKSLPTIGVDISAPDFALIAQAMGAQHRHIHSEAELTAGLLAAGQMTGPILLEIDEQAPFIAEMGQHFSYFS
ncbi:5-guanidino-2-oxopentanoate decarboxylase [Neisseriaceae bacterium CLB008]